MVKQLTEQQKRAYSTFSEGEKKLIDNLGDSGEEGDRRMSAILDERAADLERNPKKVCQRFFDEVIAKDPSAQKMHPKPDRDSFVSAYAEDKQACRRFSATLAKMDEERGTHVPADPDMKKAVEDMDEGEDDEEMDEEKRNFQRYAENSRRVGVNPCRCDTPSHGKCFCDSGKARKFSEKTTGRTGTYLCFCDGKRCRCHPQERAL